VHQSIVHTIGGVVSPAEALMLIVPDNDKLVIDVKIKRNDIDRVYVGQTARLHFASLNQRTTTRDRWHCPRYIRGHVAGSEVRRVFLYRRVEFGPGGTRQIEECFDPAGMPVEAFIKTTDRTVLSYLTKPLSDQVVKAWRE